MDPLKMHFLLKKWGYSIAMLVYQSVSGAAELAFFSFILVVEGNNFR